MDKKTWYRKIPKVDVLLEQEDIRLAAEAWGRNLAMESIHEELAAFRRLIDKEDKTENLEESLRELPRRIVQGIEERGSAHLKPVINGTGTILHTNLGRAPIHQTHAAAALKVASSYSNLEFNLESGGRGERYSHFEKLLCRITGAESAMAVNNNAASVILILSALAKGGETIVSRGELVEIGGKFRIPDVMEQSGSILREVGCTNKTHYEDYEEVIGENTRLILKVHTSNYCIMGFTESVPAKELVPLAQKAEIPLVEDLGSGILVNLEEYGLFHEPTVQEAVKNGADLVCFSGDKLLGGPQAGIIVGKKKYIDCLKKHPLTRALRIDKYTAAALEQVFLEYQWEEKAVKNIPVLRMLTVSCEELEDRGRELAEGLQAEGFPAEIQLCECMSRVGGGSMPMEQIPSVGVSIAPREVTVTRLEERLRALPVPIIGRIVNDRFLLDVRTITEEQISLILQEIKQWHVLEKDSRTTEGRQI